MIEAAWRAIRMSALWKERYEELKKRKGSSKAIVAIARKLLVTVWHVLSKEETDRNASEEDLSWKMLLWSWSLGSEARLGLTPKQFAKYSLMRLGVGNDVTSWLLMYFKEVDILTILVSYFAVRRWMNPPAQVMEVV
jgi:hypothetical protein